MDDKERHNKWKSIKKVTREIMKDCKSLGTVLYVDFQKKKLLKTVYTLRLLKGKK